MIFNRNKDTHFVVPVHGCGKVCVVSITDGVQILLHAFIDVESVLFLVCAKGFCFY